MNTENDEVSRVKPFAERLPAYLVHVFTASGGAMAFLALIEATEQRLAASFGWLGLALIVDGIDGTIARVLQVRDRAPNISGDVLDLVIDFTTYVFVPAAILLYSGYWPRGIALVWAMTIIVSAALYFADLRMKTPDHWFAGFPAVWNVVVFYLAVYRPDAWVSTAIVAAAAIGQALPFVFVHPFRVRQFQPVTLVMGVVWVVAGLVAMMEDLRPDPLTSVALLTSGAYFTGLGFFRRRPSHP